MTIIKKICSTCNKKRDISMFYTSKRIASGYVSSCKICKKKSCHQQYLNRIEYYRKKHKEYSETKEAKERAKIREKSYKNSLVWRKRRLSATRKWEKDNPIKFRALSILRNEVRSKRMIKPKKCSNCCKKKLINAHHDDYSKPLEVRWLCNQCHWDWHKDNGEGLNGDKKGLKCLN